MDGSIHQAVMVEEVMAALKPRTGGLYLDATLGGGTHAKELLERSAPDGRVVSLDVDTTALGRAKQELAQYGQRWHGVHANFRDMAEVAQSEGILPLDGILMDLGLSSDELADPERGLSFREPGPLDMRLDKTTSPTAAEIVNGWTERELTLIIAEYGEERFAGRIAAAIVRERKKKKLVRTTDLAEIVKQAVPKNYERGRIHPATRTFQALRIAVNDELGALETALADAPRLLKPGGVIAIISFHSLEDRIVKHVLRSSVDLELLHKKPLYPSEEEIKRNPRSRSAKLRAAIKLGQKNQNQNKKYDASRLFHDPTV